MNEINYEKEKRIIGFLISYYRKINEINANEFIYNKKNFFQTNCISCKKCKNSDIVCTFRTLQKVENGIVTKKECVYFRLCENLDLEVDFNRNIFTKIDNLSDTIYSALIEHSLAQMQKLFASIGSDLKKYHNYIYVNEMLMLFYDILNFSLNSTVPSNEHIKLYVYLKDKFIGVINKLLLMFLYELSNSSIYLNSASDDLLVECSQYYDDPLFFSIKLHNIGNMNPLDSYPKLLSLKNCEDELNIYQKYLLCNNLAFVELNTRAYDKAHETMKICIDLMQNEAYFNSATIKNTYRQMATIAFALKKYQETIYYLQEARKYVSDSLGVQITFLFYSLERTNQVDLLKEILENINVAQLSEKEKVFFLYYKMKYAQKNLTKKQMSDLEEYICNDLKPFINIMGRLVKNIFLEDLRFYVSNTKNYKRIYSFEEN